MIQVLRRVFKVTILSLSRLGGVMFRVLVSGPKVLGFRPVQGDELFTAIKISSMSSFGGGGSKDVGLIS
jgi:hypothetical protein